MYSAFYNAFDIFEVENGTISTYIILHLNNKGELGLIVIFTYSIDVNLTRKNENKVKRKGHVVASSLRFRVIQYC